MSNIYEQIAASLDEDREEQQAYGDVITTEAAEATAKRLLLQVSPELNRPGLEWCVFSTSKGGVDIVLCNSHTDRRIDVPIGHNGQHCDAIGIDRDLSVTRFNWTMVDMLAWVNGDGG